MFYVHGSPDGVREKAARADGKVSWDKVFYIEAASSTGIKFAGDTDNAAILFAQPFKRQQPIKWLYGETNRPLSEAVMTVNVDSGEMKYVGGGIRVEGPIAATGLSGGEKQANNLRGLNVPVAAGSKEVAVKFAKAEADNAYMAVLQLSWLTNHAVVNRTPEGFTVKFATPPSEAGELSWLLVR